MLRTTTALLATALALASACRAPSGQDVPLPDLSVPFERLDAGRVYVYRSAQAAGTVRSLEVYDGPRRVGTIGRNEFLCWDRPPGRNPLVVVYEGPRIDGGNRESVFDLMVVGGEEQFLEVHLEGGRKKPSVRRVDGATGRAAVAEREPPRVTAP